MKGGFTMKKILSVMIVLVLLIMTGVCYAENNVALYEEKLKGTSWKVINSPGSKANDKIITFTDEKKEINDIMDIVDVPYLTGDETGEVDLTVVGMNYHIWGRITLSADETFMILYVGDGASVMLVKQ